MSLKILEGLTPPQLEAATHLEGPMLVVAGAGSGKTRVVTARIAHLISRGVKPWQILAMTFTNKAAGEMRERVEKSVGEAPRWVGTFHGMCARFLRADLGKLGEERDGRFTIYDDSDQESLIKGILKRLDADSKRFKPRGVLSRISRAKCDLVAPDDLAAGSSYDDIIIGKAYREYEKRLRQMNALDFDDLLLLAVRLLEKVPGLKEEYHRRFRYILIDEYQDTNRAQYSLMRLLTGPERNVHATGDPDQSIYSWRGAEYRNIMDFTKDFPGARLVRLERNYRSTAAILEAANRVIAHNPERIEKNLFTEREGGEPVVVAALPDERAEAEWIVAKAQALTEQGAGLRNLAVFYRTNAQSRAFEEALMRAGVPYQIVGGIRFYQRKEIKDILAHLKLAVNPGDEVSLRRVVDCRPTGVGEKTVDKLVARAAELGEPVFALLAREDFKQIYGQSVPAKLRDFAGWCRRLAAVERRPVDACVESIIKVSGLVEELSSRAARDPEEEDRLDNLDQFLGRARDFAAAHPEADLSAFLEDVALVADIDSWDRSAEQLSLMTLHSAKGLEFPYVFVAGLEEGLLPHGNSYSKGGLEEERRLFYVGLTRAQEAAFVTYAASRFISGRAGYSPPSRFLEELPEELIERVAVAAPPPVYGFGRRAAPARQHRQGTEFDPDDFDFDLDFDDRPAAPRLAAKPPRPEAPFRAGDLVMHPTFGKGKLLSASSTKAVVQFFTGGTKLLSLDSAKLRKF